MTTITVKLFAAARQVAGAESIDIDLPEPPTVGALREALGQRFPQLARLLPHTRFAVDAEFAGNDLKIPPGAEVACIPPVSGG